MKMRMVKGSGVCTSQPTRQKGAFGDCHLLLAQRQTVRDLTTHPIALQTPKAEPITTTLWYEKCAHHGKVQTR